MKLVVWLVCSFVYKRLAGQHCSRVIAGRTEMQLLSRYQEIKQLLITPIPSKNITETINKAIGCNSSSSSLLALQPCVVS
jgi:hypothetical protein